MGLVPTGYPSGSSYGTVRMVVRLSTKMLVTANAFDNRTPAAAIRSMFGVLPMRSPAHPRTSARWSSETKKPLFGRSSGEACDMVGNSPKAESVRLSSVRSGGEDNRFTVHSEPSRSRHPADEAGVATPRPSNVGLDFPMAGSYEESPAVTNPLSWLDRVELVECLVGHFLRYRAAPSADRPGAADCSAGIGIGALSASCRKKAC